MVETKIFGKTFIIRLLRAKRFKKEYTIATPPPWYKNPDRLSRGQVAQIIRFSQVAHETAGMTLDQRMPIIKARASGATGYAKPKQKIPLPKFGKIITLAEKYGLPVPANLSVAPAPVAPGTRGVAVIRE